MKKGQWLKILYMVGEPRYTGKVGQVESVDDMGQIHGSWGGCALRPMDGDRYALITEDDGRAELAKQDEERKPKPVKGGSACVPCTFNGRRRGVYDGAIKVTLGGTRRCIVGLRDCDVAYVGSVVDSVTGVRNTAAEVTFTPCDLYKEADSCTIEKLKDAVRKAMEQ